MSIQADIFSSLNPLSRAGRDVLNRMASICSRIESLVPTEGHNSRSGMHISQRLPEPPVMEWFPALIHTSNGNGSYGFAEKSPDGDGGWVTKSSGATHAGGAHGRSGTCWEFNLNDSVPAPSYAPVLVKYKNDGTPVYSFAYCCVDGTSSSDSSGSGSGSQGDEGHGDCQEVLRDVQMYFNASTCKLVLLKFYTEVKACTQ